MTGTWWGDWLLGVAIGVLVLWLVLVLVLLVARPRGASLREAARLLPDTIRLVHRLGRDPELPRGVRVRLWLLLGYLALPIDLIPDVIPVLGWADDAIVVVLVLRAVVRRAGLPSLRAHWPGTEEGFGALVAAAGLSDRGGPGDERGA